MKSIRRSLIATLLITLAVLFAAASASLFFYARGALLDQFDSALAARARSFAEMVEREERNGATVIDVEFADFPLPEFNRGREAAYFEVRDGEGTPLARSRSLEGMDLARLDPGLDDPRIEDLRLPDGRAGRAATLLFAPSVELETGLKVPDPASEPNLTITIARSREDLDGALFTLGGGFVVLGLLLVAGLVLTVRWSVGRGLAPLDGMARRVSEIDPSDLSLRFDTGSLPDELAPICRRLNELLGRIESAFLRERRFSADVAHELRTPLAELRALAEVSLRREEDDRFAENARKAFRDTLAIGEQMERLVTALLSIVRCETGRQTARMEAVDLVALIRKAAPTWREEAGKRNLSLELRLPDSAIIRGDEALLTAVLSNLVGNALVYAPEGETIVCAVETGEGGTTLAVSNPDSTLQPEDLGRMLEPFWRKDPSRSDATRAGLGLPLAAAFAGIMDAELACALPEAGRFEVRLAGLQPAG